jgi:hypothetical protein
MTKTWEGPGQRAVNSSLGFPWICVPAVGPLLMYAAGPRECSKTEALRNSQLQHLGEEGSQEQ